MKYLASFIFSLFFMTYFSGQMNAQYSSNANVKSKMDELIQYNWSILQQRIDSFDKYQLINFPSPITGKKYGEIAVKGFEVKDESVKAIVFVFKNIETRNRVEEQFNKQPPFEVGQYYLQTNAEMIMWIYTDRKDEDVEWVLASLSDMIGLDE